MNTFSKTGETYPKPGPPPENISDSFKPKPRLEMGSSIDDRMNGGSAKTLKIETRVEKTSNFEERSHRDYKWSNPNNRIIAVDSILVMEDEAQKGVHMSSSFACISNEDSGDVLYQAYNVLDKSEFSFTTPNKGKILYFKPLNNEHPRLQKRDNSMVLIMTTQQVEEKEVVTVQNISVEKKKLKPLFQLQPNIVKDCQPMIVRQRQTNMFHDSRFEFLIRVEEEKLFYSRNICRDSWFLDLKHTHTTFKLEVPSNERRFVATNFDSGPELLNYSHFIVMWKNSDFYYFHVCRANFNSLNGTSEVKQLPSEKLLRDSGVISPSQQLKNVPTDPKIEYEFKFEAELSEMEIPYKRLGGSYTEVIFNRSLGLIGVAGLFTAENSSLGSPIREYHAKLVFLNVAFEELKNPSNDLVPAKVISKKISDSESEGLKNYMICENFLTRSENTDRKPQLQYAEGTFTYESKYYYVIVYGVTRSSFLACCIVRKGKLDGELIIKNKLIDLEKHSAIDKKKNQSHALGDFLISTGTSKPEPKVIITAVGKNLDIDTRTKSKIRASINIAAEPSSTVQLDLDLLRLLL
jgi:hypothetical protein